MAALFAMDTHSAYNEVSQIPNPFPMTLHKPQSAPEQKEDTSSFTRGAYFFEIRHRARKPITFKAYIRSMGIVTITSENTIQNQLKLREGNNLLLVPEEPIIYMTPETYEELGLPTEDARPRRPDSVIPNKEQQPVHTLTEETFADITGVYKKVTGEIIEEAPDSTEQAG